MKSAAKSYLRGMTMMIGMIIGVGLFGVPYTIARAGAAWGIIYFLALGAITVCLHLIYGEVLLRTGNKHRLAGLAGIYLNKFWKWLALIFSVLGSYSVIIAYIVMGGKFLQILAGPFFGGTLFAYQIIFFAVMAVLILVGLKTIVKSEIAMTSILVLSILAIIIFILPKASFANFSGAGAGDFFLPYGVILFAIGGAAAVPEVLEIMSRAKRSAKSAIFWSTTIAIALMFLFSFAVLGVTGAATTKDAIGGLRAFYGEGIIYLGAIFGLFAIATSFLPLAQYAKEQFFLDFKVNKTAAWFFSCVLPFLIFLLGTRDFIKIIGFAGAVFGGFDGILLVLIYLKAKKGGQRAPEYELRLPLAISIIIALIFLVGMAYELWFI